MTEVSANQSFGGVQKRFHHTSTLLDCEMHFSVYLPPAASEGNAPVIYWLSGLTCTDENFVHKAGAQQFAAKHGVILVAPDTSPRGEHVPDDPDGAWDFGKGAGFYVNATEKPWNHHFQMYDYITQELPELIDAHFPVDSDRCSIMGHSMGGHGALVIALRNTSRYSSVSAFAPIVAPSQVPWGQKALAAYLGENRDDWAEYDAVELIKHAEFPLPIMIDQGQADGFLELQLKPELMVEAAEAAEYPLTLERREGYDHSYFYISTFIGEHIEFHMQHLSAK
ncbi:MAG: S-formylglutathione hydrolase [Gammaproteobacteria bacterium]